MERDCALVTQETGTSGQVVFQEYPQPVKEQPPQRAHYTLPPDVADLLANLAQHPPPPLTQPGPQGQALSQANLTPGQNNQAQGQLGMAQGQGQMNQMQMSLQMQLQTRDPNLQSLIHSVIVSIDHCGYYIYMCFNWGDTCRG